MRIEEFDPAVGRHLVLMLDNRFGPPSVWRVRSTLAEIVPAFGQVPKMIDNASADKRVAERVECDPPGVAGSLAEDFKFFRAGIDAEHGAGEFVFSAILFDDRGIENTV